MEAETPDENTEYQHPENEGRLPFQERFVFKNQAKVAGHFESQTTIVNIADLDSDEEIMDRVLRGFFGFMENSEFDSRMLYERTMDILLSTRLRVENPSSFGKEIEVSPDMGFEAFLARVRSGEPNLLKDLYHIYIGRQSFN